MDKGWNVPSSLSFATYKYLEPGSYIFHVKYCDGAGIWNDTENNLEDCYRASVLENELGYARIFHPDINSFVLYISYHF